MFFRKMGVGIGGVAAIAEGNRYIYNLITKEKYYGKPTYDSLKRLVLSLKLWKIEDYVLISILNRLVRRNFYPFVYTSSF